MRRVRISTAQARGACDLPEFDSNTRHSMLQTPAIDIDNPLCIIYTSGTTGAPKGVVFTHRMMHIASKAALRVADVREHDRLFMWELLCYIGGAQMLLLPFLMQVSLVPRFSASQVERAGATQLHYLGGVFDILMQRSPDEQPCEHTLRVAWGAGVAASAWHAIEKRFDVQLRECYGMTECSSFATLNTTGKPGSIGRALPWFDLELLDENGRAVSIGEAGKIVLTSKVEGALANLSEESRRDAPRRQVAHGRSRTARCRRRSVLHRPAHGQHARAWREHIGVGNRAHFRGASCGAGKRGNRRGIVGRRTGYLAERAIKDAAVTWESLHAWASERLAIFQLPRYYRVVAQFELTASERIRKHLLSRDIGEAWDSMLH